MSLLKRGLKGAPVKRLQEALGIAADGDFGPGTERAVKAFQEANGLAVDGIAGPDTFTAMGLHELILLRVGSRGDAVKKLQESLGIGADGTDGMAGPETLVKMASFEAITQEVVAKAAPTPDEEHFESEPLPEISGIEFTKAEEPVVVPEKKSIWGKVKGWFG